MRLGRAAHRLVEALPRPRARPGASFLGAWRLIGPFAPGADPGAQDVLARPSSAWRAFDERTVCRAYDDLCDLRLWLRREQDGTPAVGAVAYLGLWVHCTTPAAAELRAGAAGPLAVRWDGRPALAADGWTLRRDARRAPLELTAGWHRLLLRLEHAGGPWGFYLRVTRPDGEPVPGLTPALEGPGALDVCSWALPRGFTGWPYAELDHRRGEPRASPFALLAGGGEPPYSWSLAAGSLPPGVALEEPTGALRGVPRAVGTSRLVVRVQDSAGTRAERPLALQVEAPPTQWYADAKLGVFAHFDKPDAVPVAQWDAGLAQATGYAERWASLAQAAGAGALVVTAKHHDGWANWPTEVRRADGVRAPRTGTDTLAATRSAALARGLRFGVYFSTLDNWHPSSGADRGAFLRFQHQQVEELVERYEPSVVWLDGHWSDPRADWGYDALCSLVHGRVPEAVVANNPGRRTLNVGDAGYGDVDVRTFEGHGYDDHPPRPQVRGRNPKPLPAEKFSFTCNWWSPGADPRWLGCERNNDWRTWARVLSEVVSEGGTLMLGIGPGYPGAPAGSPPPGELYPGARDVLEGLGAWLGGGRWEAFRGVRPGPWAPGRWGRCVQRGDRVYLHVRRAGRIALPALPGTTVLAAHVLPDRRPLPFTQTAKGVVLDLSVLASEPVLGLVELAVAGQSAA